MEEEEKIVREVAITVPINYQITEDKWLKSYASKRLKETDTIKDILDFIKSSRGDIGTLIMTELTDNKK